MVMVVANRIPGCHGAIEWSFHGVSTMIFIVPKRYCVGAGAILSSCMSMKVSADHVICGLALSTAPQKQPDFGEMLSGDD